MSWFKKVFNKLTSEEQETENKYVHKDEVEQYSVDEEQYIEDEFNEVEEEQRQEKKNFKFPMYYDEGEISAPPVQDTHKEEVVNVDDRPLKLRVEEPSIPQQQEQYTPFNSQQSQFGRPVIDDDREHYNPFGNSVYKPKKKEQAREIPKVNTKKIPSFEERKRDVKEEVVIEKVVETPPKKKFVPTEVPSPVYGFKKPTKKTAYERKVDELLVEERQRRKGTIADQLVQERLEKEHRLAHHATSIETAIHESKTQVKAVEPATSEIVVETVKYGLADVVTEVAIEKAEVIIPPVEEEAIALVEEVVTIPPVEEEAIALVEEEAIAPMEEVVTIPPVEEEAIALVEEVATIPPVEEEAIAPMEEVVTIPPVEEEAIALVEEEAIAPMEVTAVITKDMNHNRVSKTPINVVMLKSDKEKLQNSVTDSAKPFNINFPEWKKNPLKVMQSYGQIDQPIEKATAHKSVEEVHPTTENQLTSDEPMHAEVMTESHEVIVEEAIQEEVLEEEQKPAHWASYKQSLALLREPEEEQQDYEWMESQGELLKEVLAEFNVPAEVVQIFQGPTVTQFEITVGHGVKISKIKNLSDNLKLALAARDIRIEAPIPGKRTIGIEIPNSKSRPVRLSEIVGNSTFEQSSNQLEVALGLDLTGQPVTFNLSDMPHGLIAGSTGSGKSVCINSILMSLIMRTSPQDVNLMLIDPKMVELAVYDELPHLVSPVITDVKAATAALKWAVDEMERRYQLFHHMKVRHITRYNEIVEEQRRYSLKMPYLVIVIDELADLMMMAPTEVEESICRIAQKARACGIHLVLATQRPSVDVITGLIKSNIPTRIAFAVSSQIDSRTIIDSQGAERLLGKGDMLYLASGKSDAVRLQGTFVTDEEIEEVTDYIRTLGKPNYSFAPEELMNKVEREEEQDELFEEVCRHVAEEGSVSISSLQRKYRIGYNRAARLVEMMDMQGFISEARGSKPRDVFITPEKVEEIFS